MKEIKTYQTTVGAKGQITLPNELRQLLNVKPGDKIVFQVAQGKIELRAVNNMTLEDTFGGVPPLEKSENFKALRELALEERLECLLRDDNKI